jgi:hypothetical protein
VQVHYSQELNQYAWLVPVTLGLLVCRHTILAAHRQSSHHERVSLSPPRAAWPVYTLLSACALGLHYGLAFPLAALGLALARAARRPDGRSLRRPLARYGLVVMATSAGLWWLGLREQLGVTVVQRRWLGTHLAKEVSYIADQGWREVLVFFLLPFSGGPALWLVAALSLAAAAGAVRLWRGSPAGRTVVAFFFATLALVYLASLFGLYPLGHRYVLFASPPFYAALAAGLVWAWQRARPLGATLAAASAAGLLAFHPAADPWNPWMTVPREEVRLVVRDLAVLRRPGDRVLVLPGARPAFEHYDRGASGAELLSELPRPEALLASESPLWLVVSHPSAAEDDLVAAVRRAAGPRLSREVAHPGATLLLVQPASGEATGRGGPVLPAGLRR